ncbi:MAG: hypothetical protein M3R16_01975 [Pseudomonadota bacterium]|nr:hypothetical protein [Pseudomonadota bacterium]
MSMRVPVIPKVIHDHTLDTSATPIGLRVYFNAAQGLTGRLKLIDEHPEQMPEFRGQHEFVETCITQFPHDNGMQTTTSEEAFIIRAS